MKKLAPVFLCAILALMMIAFYLGKAETAQPPSEPPTDKIKDAEEGSHLPYVYTENGVLELDHKKLIKVIEENAPVDYSKITATPIDYTSLESLSYDEFFGVVRRPWHEMKGFERIEEPGLSSYYPEAMQFVLGKLKQSDEQIGREVRQNPTIYAVENNVLLYILADGALFEHYLPTGESRRLFERQGIDFFLPLSNLEFALFYAGESMLTDMKLTGKRDFPNPEELNDMFNRLNFEYISDVRYINVSNGDERRVLSATDTHWIAEDISQYRMQGGSSVLQIRKDAGSRDQWVLADVNGDRVDISYEECFEKVRRFVCNDDGTNGEEVERLQKMMWKESGEGFGDIYVSSNLAYLSTGNAVYRYHISSDTFEKVLTCQNISRIFPISNVEIGLQLSGGNRALGVEYVYANLHSGEICIPAAETKPTHGLNNMSMQWGMEFALPNGTMLWK